jgi:hypothetical protein
MSFRGFVAKTLESFENEDFEHESLSFEVPKK